MVSLVAVSKAKNSLLETDSDNYFQRERGKRGGRNLSKSFEKEGEGKFWEQLEGLAQSKTFGKIIKNVCEKEC